MQAKPISSDGPEDHEQNFEDLLMDAGDYLETRAVLWKLKTVETLSEVSSSVVSRVSLIFIFSFFIFLLSMGLAFWIGDLMGKSFYGFFIIAAFYGLVGLVCYVNRNRWFRDPVGNMIIRKILK